MVMEHFSGGTVADRLRSGRDISRALALRWLREAADALDCAHRHDVVHRDVKPANLLLDERGRLAVGDFGIATVATEASLTQTGQVLGTAAYISPEQARGQAATDASDRYALAVVAFELLTGRRPFTADHPAAQARAHVEDSVPATGLSPRLDGVISDGMAKDPAHRPPTANDLMDAVEDALDGDLEPTAAAPTAVTAPVSPRPPTTRSGRAVPAPSPRRRWPGLAALAALALVAGAAIAIAAGSGGKSTGDGGGATTAKHTSTQSATTKPKTQASKTQAQTQQTQSQAQQTTTQPPAQTQSTQTGGTQPPSTAKGDDPVALNDQGFALINQGQPAQAVAPLQRSVTAFRTQDRQGDIGYAYALYNLGNALRLSGHPADAIPYLEERLQISNYKRGVVKKELETAKQQAG